MTTSSTSNSWPRAARLGGLFLTSIVCLALSTAAFGEGEVGKPQDGNTAEGKDALRSLPNKSPGIRNTAMGFDALYTLTGGQGNTANGFQALFSNNGNFNTATGSQALYTNSVGSWNTADGYTALFNNTSGTHNTASGFMAMFNNTEGSGNSASGDSALFSNTTGVNNVAVGNAALYANTDGSQDTATGVAALQHNTLGGFNTADGYIALLQNTTGSGNTASGSNALRLNTTGDSNAAFGFQALRNNDSGGENTAVGQKALFNNTTGSVNVALGGKAGQNITTGSYNIDIGNEGVAGDANTIRIGDQATQNATFIAGISGAVVPGDTFPVVTNIGGQLGTAPSSQRFKKEIKPMENASDAILSLKPVTFRYKSDFMDTPQFGLIAEEVEKVNPNLVVHDAKGQVFTVRYEAVNAMLLNEFLKEHRLVEDLKAKVAKQGETIAQQQKGIEAVTASLNDQQKQIQKVSAQLALKQPVARTVLNNP